LFVLTSAALTPFSFAQWSTAPSLLNEPIDLKFQLLTSLLLAVDFVWCIVGHKTLNDVSAVPLAGKDAYAWDAACSRGKQPCPAQRPIIETA
jgi:hypothetical protein